MTRDELLDMARRYDEEARDALRDGDIDAYEYYNEKCARAEREADKK